MRGIVRRQKADERDDERARVRRFESYDCVNALSFRRTPFRRPSGWIRCASSAERSTVRRV